MANYNELIEYGKKHLVQTYPQPDFIITKADGVWLEDNNGNRYLDAGSGIAVNALGHNHPIIQQAIKEAMQGPIHLSNLYYNQPMLQLAHDLCQSSFADKVFFANSGSEANEGAFKFARKYARIALNRLDKTDIVAFTGSFHGRSMGAVAATATEKYRLPFAPLMPGVKFAPFNNSQATKTQIDEHTCAVIVEPVQGEGGLTKASPHFLTTLRQSCDEVGALLIFDEVQCGLARTGHLWAHQATNIQPDIMTIAKPIAAGFPMGAILVTEAVANTIKIGDHGSTFAGGPFISHIAQTVFATISHPHFIAQIAEKSEQLHNGLHQLAKNSELITEVKGLGLMKGLSTTIPAADIVKAAQTQELLILSAGTNVIRLLPPLTITHEEIALLLKKLQTTLLLVDSG